MMQRPTCYSWNLRLGLASHTPIQLLIMRILEMSLQVSYLKVECFIFSTTGITISSD